jgi:exopolysaccharide biosynthesis polyprenyl glycosylphosphotransferase
VRDLASVLDRQSIDQVMLTGRAWDVDTLRFIADTCEEVGVRFSMDANFLGLKTSRVQLEDYDGSGVLTFSATPNDTGALMVKRTMDIVGASAALVVLSPLLAVVALLIKMQDGGPVLFSQERSGLFGRRFAMLKFRSMVTDAEAQKARLAHLNEMSGPVFKMAHDPRITRLGAFIRRTSIDELPQFWNVLRGEMSLVGPRPPIPAETERYARWQLRRLSMKPGITCIWQVSGRNNIDFDTWMKLDLQYIDNWSLLLDVKLLLKTVPVVLMGTGAR